MQTDGRRDKTKLIVALRYFANGPKIQSDMFGEIIAVCSQIHTKHKKTLRGLKVELLNVKLAVHIVPFFFGSETWRLTQNNNIRVEATEMDALRRSSRISRKRNN